MAAPEFVVMMPAAGDRVTVHVVDGGVKEGVVASRSDIGVLLDCRLPGPGQLVFEKAMMLIPWSAITRLVFDRVVEEGF